MRNFFNAFDFTHLHIHAIWWILIYAAVSFSMFIDLITGIRKARQANIMRTSKLLKKTCDKAIKYFLPMLCLIPADVLASNFIQIPPFTMLMAAFNIYCEWKSVMEKTHTKKEMHEAAQTVSVIVKNKDDIAKVFAEVLDKLSKESSASDENGN